MFLDLSIPLPVKPRLRIVMGSANMARSARWRCGGTFVGRGWVGENLNAQWRTIYDFVLRRVRDPHISEDITQETLSRLVAFERAQPVENRSALGFTIARNLLRDHYRGQRPTETLDEAMPSSSPPADEIVLQRQYLAMVQQVIDAMPPLRRDIFIRRRVNGDSPSEISAALGLSPTAVEKHLVRGLADLHAATRRRGQR